MSLTQVQGQMLTGGALNVGNNTLGAGNASAFKNRIINGAMLINQRGWNGTANAAGGYGLDRFAWRSYPSTSAYSISQSTDAPAGFVNSMLITSLTSTSVGTNDYYTIGQQIEANNAYDFGFGTANAKSVTLSFWVKSSLTGTFAGGLNEANSGSTTYGFTYSIPIANTWTYITIPITGATIGTWNTSSLNSYYLAVNFGLGVGSGASTTSNGSWLAQNARVGTGGVNVVSTNAATWQFTGVQLEVGSSATSFDYRPYGTEFVLCQRYYQRLQYSTSSQMGLMNCACYTANDLYGALPFKVSMRATPTGTFSSQTGFVALGNGSQKACVQIQLDNGTPDVAEIYLGISSGPFLAGGGVLIRANSTSDYMAFSAEL